MAYATSSATNVDGVLDAFRLFAIAQSWTVNTHESITDGMWLHLSKGTAHFDLYTDNDPPSNSYSPDMMIKGATGYDAGQTHLTQPGARTDTQVQQVNDLFAGPFVSHHLFGGSDFIHCVVEVSSGRFVHFGIGTLEKAGTYGGGEYLYGERWYLDSASYTADPASAQHYYPFASNGGQVRFDENDLSGSDTYKDWALIAISADSYASSLHAICFNQVTSPVPAAPMWQNVTRQPNYFNGMSMLIPFTIACGRTSNLISILGAPKELRYINIKYLAASQELTLGSDTWLIFPVKQKGEKIVYGLTPVSGWHGIAYKKVV